MKKSFRGVKDKCRQEMAAETDVNRILARFGVSGVGPARRPVQFGEANYDMDYQQGLMAVEDAKGAFRRLPASLRQKYPSIQHLLAAVESGRFRRQPDAEAEKPVVEKTGEN